MSFADIPFLTLNPQGPSAASPEGFPLPRPKEKNTPDNGTSRSNHLT